MGSKTQNWLIGFILFFTTLFCVLIAYDFLPFLRGPAPYPPDWQWDYLFVNTLSKIWMPTLFILLTLSFAFYLEQKSEKFITKNEKKILFALVVLFFCIQIAVSYFSRAGVGVLVARIINPDMNGYFTAANSITSIPLFLAQFNENVLSLPQHAQGHPPGAILFFLITEYMMRPIAPFFSFLNSIQISHADVFTIWRGLSLSQKVTALFSTIFIPFLSSLSSVLIYYIGKYLYSIRTGIRAALLLLSIPSLILFIPINDVFLPIFPLLAFLLFIKGIKQSKEYFLFSSGIIFSLGLFFSLSIIPILFIFGVYLLWIKNIRKILTKGIVFSLGILTLPLVLFGFYNYNTITVSQTLLHGLPEHREYMLWVLFNLTDFFIFLGIPLFIIFCVSLYRQGRSILTFQYKQLDPVSVGFIGMLLILDLSGAVRGEVARIWIPFYPFLVLVLAMVLTKQLKSKSNFFVMVLFLQFVQLLCMQEFWVMLW